MNTLPKKYHSILSLKIALNTVVYILHYICSFYTTLLHILLI